MAEVVISKLGCSVLDEIWLWWGLKDELHKLKRMVSTIEAVLLHAEEQSMENPQLKNWLAMYEADALVDEFSTEALCQQVMGVSKMSKKVRLFSSSSNQFAFGLKIGHNFKALDEIAANRRFHLEERFVGRLSVAEERDQTQSSPPKVVIGRQLVKEAIVELLLSCDYEENVSVVTIFGIGGLGNITLSDDKIKIHFELKMWVSIFDHLNKWFSLEDLLVGGARVSKIVITTQLSGPISIYIN